MSKNLRGAEVEGSRAVLHLLEALLPMVSKPRIDACSIGFHRTKVPEHVASLASVSQKARDALAMGKV